MNGLDPIAAQAAKAAAAERFEAIALAHVPPGWTVAYRKSLSGRCYWDRKHIDAPRPRTRKALYIFLHECGHAALHQERRPDRAYVREFEAEKYAHDAMRSAGVAVPQAMTQRAKQYVARKMKAVRPENRRRDIVKWVQQ